MYLAKVYVNFRLQLYVVFWATTETCPPWGPEEQVRETLK